MRREEKRREEKRREVYYITTIRAIATILVVLGHAYCCYCGGWGVKGVDGIGLVSKALRVLQLVHMPIFVFISGLLFQYSIKHKSSVDLLKGRAKRILIPYFFWAIVSVFLFQSDVIDIFKGLHHLWFLLMLWWCFVLTIFVNKLPYNKVYIYIATLLINIVAPTVLTSYGGLNNVGFYYTYFYLGFIFNEELFSKLLDLKQHIVRKLLAAVVVILGLSVFLFALDYLKFVNIITPLLTRITQIAISVSSILLMTAFAKYYLNKKYSIIEYINKYSFPIYILHHIIMWIILRNILSSEFINSHIILTPVILFTVSIILSISLTKILRLTKFGRLIIG